MATTIDISAAATARKSRARKPTKTTLDSFPSPEAEEVTPIELQDITAHYSKIYGSEVVEDRAIPDFRDGLKPVHRAALWAMYVNKIHHNTQHKKAARTVGDIIGKYHPHGDTAAFGAMVTITNYVMPNLIDGKGNWGNHVNNAAHYRYVEARLSEFTDKFLLDKDYLAVVPMVENFDGTETWPLFLPALLPVQLLVGSPPAPAYGISAGTPSFKIKGVAKLVSLALAGKEITPQMCLKYLELNQRFGGICTSSDAEYLELYSTGKGSLRFVPDIVASEDQKLISVMSCCPGGFQTEKSINSSLEKIAGFPAVARVTDSSGRGGGKYGIKYNIALKRVSDDVYDDTFDKIEKAVSGSMSYHIGYTHRKRTETTFGRMNIPKFIHTWVKYRISLELAVLRYLITVEQKKLERQRLLLWGTDHIDDIALALKDRTLGPKKRLMKLWPDKSEEFVGEILKLQVQQLARLERSKVLEKIKEIQQQITALTADQKQPAVRVLRTFDSTVAAYCNKTSDRLE
jgi:DNA gyrase/topoisomerase IV subunit A